MSGEVPASPLSSYAPPAAPFQEHASQASRERIAVWAMSIALAAGTAWAVSGPFRAHAFWMNFEQDDFFYYLKIAQNLATGHGSTFNGIVPTNGYHPLWLLLIAAAIRLGAGPHGIFLFVAISVWIATMASYALTARLFLNSGLPALVSATSAAFVAVYCMHLFAEGMEVTLAVPVMLAVLVTIQATGRWLAEGSRRFTGGLRLGLLISAMVLSRLDTAIFASLLAIGVASQPELRHRVRRTQLAGLGLGLTPVLLYLLINRVAFGTFVPVSGLAKQLRLDHGFTAKVWRTFLELSASQLLSAGCIVAALLLLPWLWKRLTPAERAFVPATLLFPWVYFSALSWLSDWRVWGWYFYSLRTGFCVALLLLFRSRLGERLARQPIVLSVLVAVTLLRISRMTWDPQVPTMVAAAQDVQTFAQTHPGVYAMGDRAGTVGYLLPDPLIQTEGLVMDRAFLRTIADQTPLRAALAPFHVRYYIASAMTPYTGCFHAVEPWQAGPHAPHMRDTFCQQPIARWKHETVETLIFDLDKD